MAKDVPAEISEQLVEALADIEHQRWSHWQRYMHGKGKRLPDGSLVLPAELVARWDRQMATPYASLDSAERESDRNQVLRYLPIIKEAFGR